MKCQSQREKKMNGTLLSSYPLRNPLRILHFVLRTASFLSLSAWKMHPRVQFNTELTNTEPAFNGAMIAGFLVGAFVILLIFLGAYVYINRSRHQINIVDKLRGNEAEKKGKEKANDDLENAIEKESPESQIHQA